MYEISVVRILICVILIICGCVVYDEIDSMKRFSKKDKENKKDE